jgi:hypothetical protein
MYIFKNFPGEKPPDPRPKGRPRLTRRGARLTRGGMGDGGEGEGKGKGRGKGLGTVAYLGGGIVPWPPFG